jgi:uracil-DNA glycosylase
MSLATVKIEEEWKERLQEEFEKPYFEALTQFVKEEALSQTVYPPGPEIFRAFTCTPFSKVKVVILGQDPYHGPNQANGLCFSVREGIPLPPSLKNIFKEIESDLSIKMSGSGDLEAWANQGVLLLNATLTVRASTPGSHQGKGWEQFTDAVIKVLNEEKEGLVFLLWGAYAQAKAAIVDTKKHTVLTAPHPSPFSVYRGFYGCKHFSKTNEDLKALGKTPIEWGF